MNDEPEPERHISMAERIARLAVGAIGAYIVGYFLTMFFWTGYPHPHGIALISMLAFILLAAFFLISEYRSRP